MKDRPPKLKDVLQRVRRAVESGDYINTYHQAEENPGRPGHNFMRDEVEQALETGRLEPGRDRPRADGHDWSYSIRGKTVDRREIRVIVAFENNKMKIISAYDPNRKEARS